MNSIIIQWRGSDGNLLFLMFFKMLLGQEAQFICKRMSAPRSKDSYRHPIDRFSTVGLKGNRMANPLYLPSIRSILALCI